VQQLDCGNPPAPWGSEIVARYFMHLRDGTEQILDPEGLEFASVDALRRAVLTGARDLMTGDIRQGLLDFRLRIDAEDETGVVVYSLPFKHAVNIIPDAPDVR
jgi:hypothetical protein